MDAQTFLLSIQEDPELLPGAIETLYQFGHMSRDQYNQWQNKIQEIEAKKTKALLEKLAA